MSETLYRAAGVREQNFAEAADAYDEFIALQTATRADRISKDIHDGLNEAVAAGSANPALARQRLGSANDAVLDAICEFSNEQMRQMMRMALMADGLSLLKFVAQFTQQSIMRTATKEAKEAHP